MLVLLALLSSSPAQAAGFGSSVGISTNGVGSFMPSFDVRTKPLVLQFHVLEFLDALEDGDVFIGVNGYGTVHDADLGGPWVGEVQPGVGLDVFTAGDDLALNITAEARLGAALCNDNGGLGIYVVPMLGVTTLGEDPLLIGGGLQISSWFGN